MKMCSFNNFWMLRNVIHFLFLLCIISCQNTKKQDRKVVVKQKNLKDLRDSLLQHIKYRNPDSVDYSKPIIFIDGSKNSKYYDRITNIEFDLAQLEGIKNDYRGILKDNPDLKIDKKKNSALPIFFRGNWIVLKQFRSKLYGYYPCNFGSLTRYYICDSLITIMGHIPAVRIIKNFFRINNQYHFDLTTYHQTKNTLIIEVLDKNTGLSLWIWEEGTGKRRELAIPKKNIYHYDIIVNHCNSKHLELVFEETDISLLSKKTKK